MSDEYTVGHEDGLSPVLVLVRDAIAREAYAQLGLRNEAIQQEDIPGVAYAVTVMLDRMGVIDHRLEPSGVPGRDLWDQPER